MADTLETLEIEVKHSASKADSELAKVVAQIEAMGKSLSSLLPQLKEYAEVLGKLGGAVQGKASGGTGGGSGKKKDPLSEELQEKIKTAEKFEIATHKVVDANKRMNDAFKSGNENAAWRARESAVNAQAQVEKYAPQEATTPTAVSDEKREIIETASAIDVLEQKLAGLQAAMEQAFASGNEGKAYQLRGQIIQTQAALDKAKAAANGTSGAVKNLAKEVSKSKSPLDNFVASLKRIAFYRIIRGVIKSITQAFQEGLEKAYLFSQGMSDSGNRFAQAMDNIKSHGNQMKAQLGSAFIALLTAVEPILITLINLVTKVADALSQLFSAFTGKTYLKANATAAKFADTMKSGGKAAKEWKNQLLGFDEINRLNAPSDGGGGGGSNPLDGYDMESSPISEFWMGVADKIRPILEDIKLMFQGLRDFITGVFVGDWDLAFQGLGKIVEGFGSLVNHVLNGLVIPVFDGVAGQIIKIIDNLFKWIEDKTGLDLTKIREIVLYALNYLRFLVEGFAIQVGWIIQDMCNAVSKVFQGDWQGAWDAASKMVSDASININPTVGEMARTVTDAMVNGGNASADFAEAFSTNMETVRGQMAATGNSSIEVKASDNGISFFSRIGQYFGKVLRLTSFFGNSGFFANGGFPDAGQLFVANETGAGAELVGNIGGRTAVASNNDILEGIRQGVYDAVLAANGSGSNDVNLKVYLDSREIKVGQQRLNRAWG